MFSTNTTRAKRAFAAINTLREALLLRDLADWRLNRVDRDEMGSDAWNLAAEELLRTERRVGQLLGQGGGAVSAEWPVQKLEEFAMLAEIPADAFEREIAANRGARRRLFRSDMLRLARRIAAQNHQGGEQTDLMAPQGAILSGEEGWRVLMRSPVRFGTIYVDPPWDYANRASRGAAINHYPTLDMDAIAGFPVGELADQRAHLHLWTTNAFLFESRRLLKEWGFDYKGLFVWTKPQMGMGNYWRVSHELMILGVRGDLRFEDRAQKSWMALARQRHSQKPDEVRAAIEAVSPAPRLEMFARRLTPGWICWGNEIGDGILAEPKRID